MEKLAHEFSHLIAAMQNNMTFALKIVGLLWAIQILNALLKYQLNQLGLLPRSIRGIPGIFFSPFLHGDFNHLFFNTIPLFILSDLILLQGHALFYMITLMIVIIGGVLLWIFGSKGIHIGASSVIMGYFGYLLAKAYFQVTATTVILAGLCLYYVGGLFLSLFPSAQKNVSLGGHVFGFAAGIATAYFLKTVLWAIGY